MGRQDGRDRQVSDERADDAGATILHADLDAFFASVELLDRPELRGKPVIVGRDSPRAVVTAATYEARRYGVNSAMPMSVALRRCPQAIIVEPHYERYAHWSSVFFDVCRTITPLVEEIGIDEAFLDVSGAVLAIGSPRAAGELLRERVRERTGLVVSVGIAGTKFVAKLASGRSKPDGLLVVPVAETLRFLGPMPVNALSGIGGKLGERLTSRGIATVGELADTPLPTLRRALGDALAHKMHELSHGIDARPVVTHRDDVTMGRETTFEDDVSDREMLQAAIRRLSDDVGSRLRRAGAQARTVSIKVRFGDFRTITRSRTLPQPTDVGHAIYEAALALLTAEGQIEPVRLIGVRAELGGGQAGLWEDDSWREAEQVVDRARERFGRSALTPARLLSRPPDHSS